MTELVIVLLDWTLRMTIFLWIWNTAVIMYGDSEKVTVMCQAWGEIVNGQRLVGRAFLILFDVTGY